MRCVYEVGCWDVLSQLGQAVESLLGDCQACHAQKREMSDKLSDEGQIAKRLPERSVPLAQSDGLARNKAPIECRMSKMLVTSSDWPIPRFGSLPSSLQGTQVVTTGRLRLGGNLRDGI